MSEHTPEQPVASTPPPPLRTGQPAPSGRPEPPTAPTGPAATAADPAVSRYLAAVCGATKTPLLHASATAGAYGGLVALLPPGAEACWWCLLHHRHDGSLPVPPAATGDEASVVPAGCAQPTFTGTGADLTTVAVHAARVAIGHLTGESPNDRARVYVGALRDHHGRPRAVRWRTRTLTRHPACPAHAIHSQRAEQPAPTPSEDAGSAIAAPSASKTMTTAAGDPANGAAAARTLTPQQSKQSQPAPAPTRRGGA